MAERGFCKRSLQLGRTEEHPQHHSDSRQNPKYETPAGNNTTDQVFLLSITEANKYFSSDSVRQCQGTAYCYRKGSNGNCWWWLRSPGRSSYRAAGVYSGGSVYDNGDLVDDDRDAVRPALWIDLDS